MQDDPPEDELDESQSESCDVDDNDATKISEAETEKQNTGDADSNGVEEPPQSLLVGDSIAGDIESIVASDIFVDEGLVPAVLETDESGSLLVQGSRLKGNNEISGIESSGIIDSDPTIKGSNVGSISREVGGPFGIDYAKMTFWEFLVGLFGVDDVDDLQAWDVDLGEFLNDVEDDPDAATMLGTANEFDLDAEGSSTDDPSQSADLASSQAGNTSGTIDDGLFGDELSIEQYSVATKWPFFQKSRPEDYDDECDITASYHRRRSRKFTELLGVAVGVALCIILAFLIAWLPFVVFSICMFLGYV